MIHQETSMDYLGNIGNRLGNYFKNQEFRDIPGKLSKSYQKISEFSAEVFEGVQKGFNQEEDLTTPHSFGPAEYLNPKSQQGTEKAGKIFKSTLQEDHTNSSPAFKMGAFIGKWGKKAWESAKDFSKGVDDSGKANEGENATTSYKLGKVFKQTAKETLESTKELAQETLKSTKKLAQRAWKAIDPSQTFPDQDSPNQTSSSSPDRSKNFVEQASLETPVLVENSNLKMEKQLLEQQNLENHISQLNEKIIDNQDQLHQHIKELGLACKIDASSVGYQGGPPNADYYIHSNPELQNHPELIPHFLNGFNAPVTNSREDAAFCKEYIKGHSEFNEQIHHHGNVITKEDALMMMRTSQENVHESLTTLQHQQDQLHELHDLHQIHQNGSLTSFVTSGDLLIDTAKVVTSIATRALAMKFTRTFVDKWVKEHGAEEKLPEAEKTDTGFFSKVKNVLKKTSPKVLKTVSCAAIGASLLCGGGFIALGVGIVCAGVEQYSKSLRAKENLDDPKDKTPIERKVDEFCHEHPVLSIAAPILISAIFSPAAGFIASSACAIIRA